jgi:hypothetical protein
MIKTWVQVLFLCKAEQGIFHFLETWQVGWVKALFLCKAEQGIFHFLENVTGWLVPSATQKFPVQPGWYISLQKIPNTPFLACDLALGEPHQASLTLNPFALALIYLHISRQTWLVPKFQPFRTDSDSLLRLTKPLLSRLNLSLTWSQPRLNSQSPDGLRSGVGYGSAPSWTKTPS